MTTNSSNICTYNKLESLPIMQGYDCPRTHKHIHINTHTQSFPHIFHFENIKADCNPLCNTSCVFLQRILGYHVSLHHVPRIFLTRDI